jgi:hypothetical protein
MCDDEIKLKPETQDEWTIHALNIHGAFLEKKCVDIIQQTSGYTVVSTNYPVEFPPPINGIRGRESALDIRAEFGLDYHRKMTLIIECKKNNPDFVDWIFFPAHFPKRKERLVAPFIFFEKKEKQWRVRPALGDVFLDEFDFTDEARETKGKYQSIDNKKKDKTKTANNSISEAAYQVTLATQSIFWEEINKSKTIAEKATSSFGINAHNQVILPVIVTTAKLFVCNFAVQDISINTGEIHFDKVKLKTVPYLIYKFPLPRHLHFAPENMEIDTNQFTLERFVHSRIIVVNSENFQEFLGKIVTILRDSIF